MHLRYGINPHQHATAEPIEGEASWVFGRSYAGCGSRLRAS